MCPKNNKGIFQLNACLHQFKSIINNLSLRNQDELMNLKIIPEVAIVWI